MASDLTIPGTHDVAAWVAALKLIDTSEAVIGGIDGVSNAQAIQLAKRSQWLKAQIDAVIAGAGLTPDAADLDQLADAIVRLIASALGTIEIPSIPADALRASVSSAVTAAYPATALAAAAVEGTVTLDFAARDNHAIAVTSDITIALPTGGVVGNQYYAEATQDATGGHAATWAAGWIVRQGEWATDPNAINCLYITVTGGGPVVDIAQAAEV